MSTNAESRTLTVSQVLSLGDSNPFTRAVDDRLHVIFETRSNWRWVEHELARPLDQRAIKVPKAGDLTGEVDG